MSLEIDKFLQRYPDIYFYIKRELFKNSVHWYYYIDDKYVLHMELMQVSIISDDEHTKLINEINNLLEYGFINAVSIAANMANPFHGEWFLKFDKLRCHIRWKWIAEYKCTEPL